MTPPYSTSARLPAASRFPRTDGLGEDRNGRAKVLLAVVVVVVLVVLVVLVVVLPLQILQAKS